MRTIKLTIVLLVLCFAGCKSSFSCWVQKDWQYDTSFPEPGVTSRVEITLEDPNFLGDFRRDNPEI